MDAPALALALALALAALALPSAFSTRASHTQTCATVSGPVARLQNHSFISVGAREAPPPCSMRYRVRDCQRGGDTSARARLEKGSYFVLTVPQVRQVSWERNCPKKMSVTGLSLRDWWLAQATPALTLGRSTNSGLGWGTRHVSSISQSSMVRRKSSLSCWL